MKENHENNPTAGEASPAFGCWAEWMPIETAPKKGKAILVFRADNLCAFCANWCDITKDWRHFGGAPFPIGGEITHWMPLPPNPPNDTAHEPRKERV